MADLNLLITLNVLLTEGSVARAARRLQLSPSAMSRALARLREATGDPLLVRAGRGLVPTPRALELRARVGELVHEAEAMLRPLEQLQLDQLKRDFTLRSSEGFVENFGAALLAGIAAEAPGVRLCFVAKRDRESTLLRDGSVDLETGVVSSSLGPELRAQALFRDQFIGVTRFGHPLSLSAISASNYSACKHILVTRRGAASGPIDQALDQLGLKRQIATTVEGFSTALALARSSDLVASVPARHTGKLREGMFSFALPFTTPEMTISLLWHPRMQADPAHRWLRAKVLQICAQ